MISRGAAIGAFAGLGLCLLLAYHIGLSALAQPLAEVGWSGLALMVVAHLPSLILCALAWRCLLDARSRNPILAFTWFRWVRDAASNLIPILPVAGELLAVRLLKVHRYDGYTASASLIVDVTLELISQLGFTALGLVLLFLHGDAGEVVTWAVAGSALAAPLFLALLMLQNATGARLLMRLSLLLSEGWQTDVLDRIGETLAMVRRIYARRRRIAAAVGVHLLAWLAGVAEAWVALKMLGVDTDIGMVLILESMVFALRSAAFIVPAGIGVQEGGYVLVGAYLGIGPETAFSLSLLKRGREIILGLPALLSWQLSESWRLGRTFRASTE